MVDLGSGSKREIDDVMLTRYACYLIAMNGDSSKKEIAFALIRSKGDAALFQKTTQEMKHKWGIMGSKPLADFMPTILLKAKDFATEITIHNAKEKRMKKQDRKFHRNMGQIIQQGEIPC